MRRRTVNAKCHGLNAIIWFHLIPGSHFLFIPLLSTGPKLNHQTLTTRTGPTGVYANGRSIVQSFAAIGTILWGSTWTRRHCRVSLLRSRGCCNGTDASVASVPESLRKEIEAYLHLPQHTALSDVKAIVEAIDHVPADGREALCHRLDTWSSAILCGILKRSEDCLAYQRGLCLLTVSSLRRKLRPGQLKLFRNLYTRMPCLRKANELCAQRRRWHWEV